MMHPQAKKSGGMVENPKMSKKLAGFFAKKGEKKLAAHEYREAAGKEEDTKAIAKKEERALKGAPADMKAYESKEHKAMGYKKGGKVKPNFAKKFGSKMKPPGPAKGDSGLPAIGPMPPKDAAGMLPTMGGMGGGMKPPGMKKGGMACGGKMKYATGGPINGIPKPPKGEKYDSAANDWMAGEMETEMEKERKKAKPAPAPKPKAYAKGGMVRGDGAAMRGKTKCKVC